MRAWRQFGVGLTAVLVLTSCGFGGDPEVIAPTRPAPAPSSAAASPAPSSSASAPASSATPEPSPASKEDLQAFYDQKIKWTNCGNADCGTLTVPLDYTQPDGPTIELAVSRVKSTGEAVASLFVDPGGPGGSAVDYAKAADRIVSPDVLAHYDVVGVDPRGVGRSEPVRCMTDKQIDVLLAADGTPDSPAEVRGIVDDSRLPGIGCLEVGGPVYEHMGTVDAARDLDIARAAVGDETFNYLGKSYGTMLGATYAELFPDRVGRMVLDGVLPANLDLVEVTKGQADSFEVAVHDFVADCLSHDDCPLSGTEEAGVEQLQQWFLGLDGRPLKVGDRELNETLAAYAVLSYLYFPSNDYPQLRSALRAGMNDGNGGPLLALLDARIDRAPDGRYTSNSTDAFYAVTCLDRPFTGTVADVKRYAQEWSTTAPTFGPALAWGLLTCKDWPATGEAISQTPATGSNPILVVSTTHDPATPYQWGEQVAGELDNARLLTWDDYSHTAYMRGSACITAGVDAYLLKGTLPEDGTVCS